mmetsp:Transcript_30090/g.57792  ORF Transcript_30090/g.57792 Transcript_30090/m.57792 type:complete len:295 (-) Transcript_30090:240-1124(-)
MIPDDRCVGGRQSVELELHSMRRKILNAKSSIDNKLDGTLSRKINPRKSPRPASPMRRSFDLPTSETRETFRRVAEVSQRGMSKEGRQRGSLNQPPVSYAHNLSKRISANKKIGRETTERTLLQHHNNVVHMYRRMEHAHSLTERKKNVHDAALYPCYLRRRMAKDQPSGLVRTSLKANQSLSEYTSAKSYNMNAPDNLGRRTVPKYRPISAPPLHPVRYASSQRNVDPIAPHLQSMYMESYSALMEAIVSERMYQEAPLKKLFQEFLRNSVGEMEEVARRVVDDLKAELDVRD